HLHWLQNGRHDTRGSRLLGETTTSRSPLPPRVDDRVRGWRMDPARGGTRPSAGLVCETASIARQKHGRLFPALREGRSGGSVERCWGTVESGRRIGLELVLRGSAARPSPSSHLSL